MGFILDLLMGVVTFVVVVFIAVQVVIPACSNRPLFPAFRKTERVMDEESEAQDELEMWRARQRELRTKDRAGEIIKGLEDKTRRKP